MERKADHAWDSVIGLNSLQELLQHAPERIVKILAQKNTDVGSRKDKLLALIKEKGVALEWVPKDALNTYAAADSHQGFLAYIKKRSYLDLFTFMQDLPERALILALDSIYDPHNFGALLRSAECFGASAVLFSKNRGVDITPVVTKTSSGASEMVPLLRVSNLATTLLELKKKGFAIIAADANDNAESLYDFSFPDLSVLVMGSEGEGIQPLILKMCDHTLFIPMHGKISSLNVSQAAAVCLSSWRSAFSIA